jgi:hypothetical protein
MTAANRKFWEAASGGQAVECKTDSGRLPAGSKDRPDDREAAALDYIELRPVE